MSLFACENCGVVENTALCGIVFDRHRPRGEQRVLICSLCNPDIRKWHGFFPREDAKEAGYVQMENSRYITKIPK